MCLLGKAQSPSAASLSLEHTLLDCGKNDLTKTLQCHYIDEGPMKESRQIAHYLPCNPLKSNSSPTQERPSSAGDYDPQRKVGHLEKDVIHGKFP